MTIESLIRKLKRPFKAHVVCPRCGCHYVAEATPQRSGFRDYGEEICPKCGKVNRRSLDFDFITYPEED